MYNLYRGSGGRLNLEVNTTVTNNVNLKNVIKFGMTGLIGYEPQVKDKALSVSVLTSIEATIRNLDFSLTPLIISKGDRYIYSPHKNAGKYQIPSYSSRFWKSYESHDNYDDESERVKLQSQIIRDVLANKNQFISTSSATWPYLIDQLPNLRIEYGRFETRTFVKCLSLLYTFGYLFEHDREFAKSVSEQTQKIYIDAWRTTCSIAFNHIARKATSCLKIIEERALPEIETPISVFTKGERFEKKRKSINEPQEFSWSSKEHPIVFLTGAKLDVSKSTVPPHGKDENKYPIVKEDMETVVRVQEEVAIEVRNWLQTERKRCKAYIEICKDKGWRLDTL